VNTASEPLDLMVQTDELIDSGLPLEGVDAVHWFDEPIAGKNVAQAEDRKQLLKRWLGTCDLARLTGQREMEIGPPQ
jgi:hypothetical protein